MKNQLHFLKMHGCGNDYVFVDCCSDSPPSDPRAMAVKISDRHTSIGADGLVLMLPSDVADVRIRMFNSDGSEGAMCGNALRCVALWLFRSRAESQWLTGDRVESASIPSAIIQFDSATQPDIPANRNQMDGPEPLHPGIFPCRYRIQTQDRVVEATVINYCSERQSAVVCVNMGPPSSFTFATGFLTAAAVKHFSGETQGIEPSDGVPQLAASQATLPLIRHVELQDVQIAGKAVRLACVSMGNPHAVIFVSDLASVPLQLAGPAIENHQLFPDRTNVEFAEIINSHHVRVRVWERGSGETMACGSGACAVAVAGIVSGWLHPRQPILIDMSGGQLQVSWPDQKDVLLQGMASLSFTGVLPLHGNQNTDHRRRQEN